MRKYVFLCCFYIFISLVLVLGVFFCPDFMFLQSYSPNFESLDFICGSYTVVIGFCFVSFLILFSFVTCDFFKRKSSGKEPDKNKNENKE